MFTLGAGYRTGGIANVTAAVKIYKKLLIGYSREMFSANFQRNVGATNEFTVRLDFRDRAYHTKVKNARSISTQAMAVRRKTLVSYSSKGTALQKSQRYKKQIRKNAIHSPNYRMSTSTKLQNVKMSKKSAGPKKRKKAHHPRRR